MIEILEQEHAFYTLSRDTESNEHILEVECGTTAVYTVSIKLTAGEIAKYQSDRNFVRILAYQILDNPDAFLGRRI